MAEGYDPRRGNSQGGCNWGSGPKVVFTSDVPSDPEKDSAYTRWTIDIIDALDITPQQRHAIYEGNARRLLKLE
jgi:uncharacterized protein